MASYDTQGLLGMAADTEGYSPIRPGALGDRAHRLSAEVQGYGPEPSPKRSGTDSGDVHRETSWAVGDTEAQGSPLKGLGVSGGSQPLGDSYARDPSAPRRTVVRDFYDGTASLIAEPLGQTPPQAKGTVQALKVYGDSDEEDGKGKASLNEEWTGAVAVAISKEERRRGDFSNHHRLRHHLGCRPRRYMWCPGAV